MCSAPQCLCEQVFCLVLGVGTFLSKANLYLLKDSALKVHT